MNDTVISPTERAYGRDAELSRLGREVLRILDRIKANQYSVATQIALENAARVLALRATKP